MHDGIQLWHQKVITNPAHSIAYMELFIKWVDRGVVYLFDYPIIRLDSGVWIIEVLL